MKNILVALLLVLTAGCASGPSPQVTVANLEASDSLNVTDSRPASEKESKLFSLSIFSEAYGTYRRGDKELTPNVIRLLQHRVHEKYADADKAPKVNVKHFVVYMNLKSELRKGAVGVGIGGIIGGVIAGSKKYGVEGVASVITEEEFEAYGEEYKRTLFTEQENPKKVSVYIVYLQADIDGKTTFIRTMTPVKLPEEIEEHPHAVAAETAIGYFLDQY